MDALQQMYQQVILDHAKKPHGRVAGGQGFANPNDSGIAVGSAALVHAILHDGETAGDNQIVQSHQINPTCGDEITLALQVENGKIESVTWAGQGCSISQASASVMTDLVSGAPVAEALKAEQLFHQLMNSRGKGLDDEAAEDALGDAIAFTGTSQYPARIKCALLGWMALKDALGKTNTAKVENNG